MILTEEGRSLIDQTPDPLHERFTQRFEALPGWEQAMLLGASERLASLFDAEDTTPLPTGDEIRPATEGASKPAA